MSIQVRDAGGTLRTITAMKLQDVGVQRNIARVKVYDGSVLRTVATFASTLAASASPSPASQTSFSSNVLVSPAITVTPSGGLPPYSYAWTLQSGTATINSPTSATTTLTSETLIADEPSVGSVRCVCTDSAAQSVNVDVSFSFVFFTPPS